MSTQNRAFLKTLTALMPIPLIVAWAFANFMYSNRFDDFLYSQLAQYFFFMSLAFVLPAALALLFFPAQRRAIAVISYLGTAALFLLPGIIDAIGPVVRERYIEGPVLLVALLAGLWLQGKLAGKRYIRGFAFTFLLLTAIPLVQLGVHQVTVSGHPSRAEVPLQGEAIRRPNVYFILLDAYARADQLKSVMGFDNGPFLKALENQDFFIASESYASYPRTVYSATTTFRMAYASGFEPSIWQTLFNSATFRNFRQLGYRLVHIPALPDQIRCAEGVECFFHESTGETKSIDVLGINLLGMLPALPTLVGRYFPALHSYTTNELDNLLAFLKEGPPKTPTFIYAHFDMPHPPYLRDADCNPTPPSVRKSVAHIGWGTTAAYAGFLRCGNEKVLKVVRQLVENDPEAIIILQSDHGSYFRRRPVPGERRLTARKKERWYIDALEESLGTLNVWRLPAPCRKWLTPDFSNINTFRLVFGCLTGNPPQFLPNRSYWIDDGNKQLLLVREDGRWTVPAIK